MKQLLGEVLMKTKWTSLTLAVLCVAALAAVPAMAESHEEGDKPAGPTFWPMEIFACNFNEGQTMKDLMEVTAAWNAWMDENARISYWASTLMPVFHSAEIDFDIAWVGGWESGAAMGESMQAWITNGGEHQAGFARVVDCSQHTNFAVMTVQPNPNPFAPGPVTFRDCKVSEGVEFPAAAEAVGKWAAYTGDNTGQYMLFPAYGAPSDVGYSFKWVSVTSWSNLGVKWDDYGTGGGYMKYREITEGVMKCDSPRVYHGMNVRKPAVAE
jgi:hypothetical protein